MEILLEVDSEALQKIGADSTDHHQDPRTDGRKICGYHPVATVFGDTGHRSARDQRLPKLDDVVQKAGATFDRSNTIVDNINQGKGTLGKLNTDPALYHNIVKLTGEMNSLAVTINRGNGTLGKLARSPEPYDRLIRILDRADRTLQDIQTSEGTLNKMIYDKTLYTKWWRWRKRATRLPMTCVS